jgi:hypothetical protein
VPEIITLTGALEALELAADELVDEALDAALDEALADELSLPPPPPQADNNKAKLSAASA